MGSRVITSSLLANGLRSEFNDTYEVVRQRQVDSRLSQVMDLGVGADNRVHEFGYLEASPHAQYWERNTTIPTDAMDSVSFSVPIYEWGRRVMWSKWDRMDERTNSLVDMARGAGTSHALLPERFFFDLIAGATDTLPATVLAPDGVAMFNKVDGLGAGRFGITDGNLLTGTGIASVATVLSDYYSSINQFKLFEDGKGQPMLDPGSVDQGVIIIHPIDLTEVMEETFIQKRQVGTGGSTPSNVVQDASRTVELWGTPRLANGSNDWYVFLKGTPKLPTFLLDRMGVQEFSALEGDNNSDANRANAEEYIQWESRSGGGIALPYGAIKVNN